MVGRDWGSATASILSMFHPTRVQRLVLMSAGHPSLFHQLGLQQLERAWYMQFFQAVDIAAEWLSADDWENFRMWGRHPNEDEAPRLSHPTLGIWGANDDHLVEGFVTQTDRYTDGHWRYERIEDAGHWIQLDQPDVLAELLVSHLTTSGISHPTAR